VTLVGVELSISAYNAMLAIGGLGLFGWLASLAIRFWALWTQRKHIQHGVVVVVPDLDDQPEWMERVRKYSFLFCSFSCHRD
jgi:hypothetical protein